MSFKTFSLYELIQFLLTYFAIEWRVIIFKYKCDTCYFLNVLIFFGINQIPRNPEESFFVERKKNFDRFNSIHPTNHASPSGYRNDMELCRAAYFVSCLPDHTVIAADRFSYHIVLNKTVLFRWMESSNLYPLKLSAFVSGNEFTVRSYKWSSAWPSELLCEVRSMSSCLFEVLVIYSNWALGVADCCSRNKNTESNCSTNVDMSCWRTGTSRHVL